METEPIISQLLISCFVASVTTLSLKYGVGCPRLKFYELEASQPAFSIFKAKDILEDLSNIVEFRFVRRFSVFITCKKIFVSWVEQKF